MSERKPVQVALTPAQNAAIKQAAAIDGMRPSTWLRQLGLRAAGAAGISIADPPPPNAEVRDGG